MNELYHYGIKDMHWGNRRYQNYDGSLTPAGRARYGVGAERVRSALNTTKNMIKYSNAAFAYRGAKRRAEHEFRYGVSPKLKKAKRIANERFEEASSKARDAGERVSSEVSSASRNFSRKLSRAATDASIQGRMLGRELSYLSTTTMNKVDMALNANSREAARLRSYIASDQFTRAKKAQLYNLRNQNEYRIRKSAGKSFVDGLANLGRFVEMASDQRVTDRTNGSYGTGLSKMTGGHYSFLKKHGRSSYKNIADEIASDYARSVYDWQERIAGARKYTSSSFSRARGR